LTREEARDPRAGFRDDRRDWLQQQFLERHYEDHDLADQDGSQVNAARCDSRFEPAARPARFISRGLSAEGRPMRRWWRGLVLGLLVASCVGCSGQADKNKNKDLDRPKPAEKEKGP
jgi:hypothetical protein